MSNNPKYPLPAEFAKNWITALKTTPEEQHGTGRYYDPQSDCYCAMGVGFKANGIKFNQHGNVIGDKEAIISGSQIKPGDNLWCEVYVWNDRMKFSFKKIACLLEQSIEFF